MKKFSELLRELRACSDAREWAREMTIEEVVSKCERGDWLLWLAKKVNVDNRRLTLAKGKCANTVRHLMKDDRSIAAVDAAIAYGNGKITDKELADAADAADDASYAFADDASYAADYAVSAAYSYAVASSTAAAAGYATNADADAAESAANAAKKENKLQTAKICRDVIGQEIIERVNELLNQ